MAVGAALGRHGEVGHRRHGGATGGHPAVEVDQLVADLATGHHALEGGRLDDPVAQRERAEGGRGEDLGGGRAGGAWHGPTFADAGAARTLGQCAAPAWAARSGRSGGPLTPQDQHDSLVVRGRRHARRVADGQGGDEAAGGAGDAGDDHGGAEAGGQLGGAQGGGTGQAGEQRQDGHGQQPGGTGHHVVDGGGDAGVLGRRGAHGRRGQRRDGDGQAQGEEQHGGEHLGPIVPRVGGAASAGRGRRRRREAPPSSGGGVRCGWTAAPSGPTARA